MTDTFDFIIVGTSIAALISSIELAKNDYRVGLVNPSSAWGAHFGGITINNDRFDIGMNLFEFTSFNEDSSSDILSYDPLKKGDVGRFFSQIERYVKTYVECVEVDVPKMTIGGLFSNDIVISNRFEILKVLPPSVQLKIQKELRSILDSGKSDLHASNKSYNNDLFLNTSFREVSIANHGETFHELFVEPICIKILNLSSKFIPALYHRVAWAPLFYPETLYSQFTDTPQALSQTVFHYPKAGNCATFVTSLLKAAEADPHISFISRQVAKISTAKGTTLEFEGGESITSNRLIWNMDLLNFLKLSEKKEEGAAYEKASVAIGFLKIDSSKLLGQFSTLYIADRDNLIYRITNQSVCSSIFEEENLMTIELNFDLLQKAGLDDNATIIDYIAKKLVEMQIVASAKDFKYLEIKHFKNALVLPTAVNYHWFEKTRAYVKSNYTSVDFLGASAAFSAASLNDNIVQGLRIGKQYANFKI